MVEQITGFGSLVCEQHRSVPVVSGSSWGLRGEGTCVSRGKGPSHLYPFGVGGSTLTLKCLGGGKTLLV